MWVVPSPVAAVRVWVALHLPLPFCVLLRSRLAAFAVLISVGAAVSRAMWYSSPWAGVDLGATPTWSQLASPLEPIGATPAPTLPTQEEAASTLLDPEDSQELSRTPAPELQPKRRRLTMKQPPPGIQGSRPLPGTPDDGSKAATSQPGVNLADKQQYLRFYHSVSRWVKRWRKTPECPSDISDAALTGSWAKLCSPHKKKLVAAWAKTEDIPLELRQWGLLKTGLDVLGRELSASDNAGAFVHSKEVLLTYNGAWGNFDWDEVGGLLSLTDAASSLQDHPRIIALKRDIDLHTEKWQEMTHWHSVAWSIELSCKTYVDAKAEEEIKDLSRTPSPTTPKAFHFSQLPSPAEERLAPEAKPVRCHIHVYMRWQKQTHIRKAQTLSFKGSLPNKSSVANPTGGRMSRLNNMGYYYLQCPKIGSIAWGGSVEPFADYLVNSEWIMNMLQQQKMTYESARSQLVKVAKALPRTLPAIDLWKREVDCTSLSTSIADTLQELRGSRMPFVEIPQVTAWLRRFDVNEWRYPFLVLEGPSMVGKTQFARNLASTAEAVLEIDCAGATEPDARGFQAQVHEVIIFDEASATMVLRCKKLFQSGACWVTLSQSATNCHAFRMWPHRTKMVVCSNRWWSELDDVNWADRSWLVQNSEYVWVDTPLWVETELPSSQKASLPHW